MKINEVQDNIINEFSNLPDWLQKYEHLINLGKTHPGLHESLKTDKYALPGCQSQVWIHAILQNGKIFFETDSDSLIIRGILSLLKRVLNDQPPLDISHADLYFLQKTGLHSSLSPIRANGVSAIVKRMQDLAEAIYE